jgi:tetratricopeptide (TPR) repeat protein
LAKPESPKSYPPPLPLSGVAKFVGRTEDLLEVHRLLQADEPVVLCALKGMGGIGKTELALQYAYGQRAAYPGGIGWFNADGDLELQLTPAHLPPAPSNWTPQQRLDHCWAEWPAGLKLLVFDNVQDFASIKPYLPPTGQGFRVLMTSRRAFGAPVSCYEIKVLSEAAALDLLGQLGDPEGEGRIDRELAIAQHICAWLGYLPLGLELVGRYLAKKPDLTLAKLWQVLQAQKLDALLAAEPEMTATSGVVTAFNLSWELLSEAAQELAMFLSLFALAEIPWQLVESCWEAGDVGTSEDVRDAELWPLSLLNRVGQGRYELHQLLREFFGAKLQHSPAKDYLITCFAQAMTAVAQTVEPIVTVSQQASLELAIPHLRAAIDWADYLPADDKTWCCTGVARFYQSQSIFTEAELLYVRSLDISEKQLGEEHPSTASSLNNIAGLYESMGRYEEAEPLYVRSLKIREKKLGAEHPFTASSLNNIAELYRSMGRYEEAEPLYVRSLAIREKHLGEEHPDTAASLNNIAGLYYNSMRRYEEAEPFYVRSLAIREKHLGEEHPDTAASLNNIAVLYYSMGRYEEAEPLYVRSLKIREKHLGEEHPDTAASLNNIALLYTAMERYEEAEPLYVRSLKIREKKLGAEHPSTASSLNNIAGLYRAMGRYEEAEPLYVRSLKIREKHLGEEHPGTATSLNNIAVLYYSMERYEEVKVFLIRAIAIVEKKLGPNHPNTMSFKRSLEILDQR